VFGRDVLSRARKMTAVQCSEEKYCCAFGSQLSRVLYGRSRLSATTPYQRMNRS
jgi:hypothetical protein